jgi:uncharacterized protein (UPF0261 family)/ABC-type branched-subunit amino acid transport system ATPase component
MADRIPSGAMLARAALEVRDLHVYYGGAHALQGVTLKLERGVLAVVGRNGMGKTTLCNAIMGLVPAAGGSIRAYGEELVARRPHAIAGLGIGYVPQGRRVWPSLSVDEHLRLAGRRRRARRGTWTVERIYETFPRLAERRRNGAAQLSGGEQQMLAIGRALLANPRLLIMDEPTEGLAPLIVEQVALTLRRLADEGEIALLLIEQNLGVAADVATRVAVMVNGRIARELDAAALAADEELQQRLLGVRRAEDEEPIPPDQPLPSALMADAPAGATAAPARVEVLQVRRAGPTEAPALPAPPPNVYSIARAPTRWAAPAASDGADTAQAPTPEPAPAAPPPATVPISAFAGRAAYVAGTFDTKGRELAFIKQCLDKAGLRTITVDLGTSRKPSPATINAAEVARHHPRGAAAVFSSDRGAAVAAMAEAFERFIATRRDVGGIISAGGSGGTSLATPAMRRLPIGVPKVMVSTVASGDVQRYVGPSDICMMYSVTDVQGINRISEQVLSNAAHALAGMMAHQRRASTVDKPAIGLTMFGLTTPCVQAVVRALEDRYDCLVFHATGTGGQSMEKLADSGLLAGFIDATTTEVADLLMGGVMSAGEARLDSIARTRLPYVGSCGALDMVNFGPLETVPERYRGRNLHVHNPNVTLMRTTPEENAQMGRWIGEKLNRCEGPVRFLIPEKGVSGIDAPGQPFHDPAADAALFKALGDTIKQTERRRLIRLPHHINDPAFAAALVANFLEIAAPERARAMAR